MNRDADQFHQFLPSTLPHAYSSSDECLVFAPLAIQVTLFPNQGIAIGHTLSHAIADGATILSFQLAWASINKFDGDAHLREKITSFYTRNTTVANRDLAMRAWNHVKTSSPTVSLTVALPTDKVRATFFLNVAQIEKLKSIAVSKKQDMANIASSMVVLSGYVWSCLAKSAEAAGEEVSDEEAEYLTCTADVRARFTPPLPRTYFGNCIVLVLAESTHGRLKGENGFVGAAHAIGEAIREIKSKRDNVFDDLEERIKVKGKRVVTIAASPRFDYYGVDYGWGRPKKIEYPTNDCDGSVFTCKPRAGGGVEIGMSMPKLKMDAFASFFHLGIAQTMPS